MKSTRFYFTFQAIPLPYLQIKRRCVALLLLFLLPAMASAQVIFEKPGTTLEQASAKAKAEDKLIFAWCVDRNSIEEGNVFKDSRLGDFMNKHFVNVIIDRKSPYGAQLLEKKNISDRYDYSIFNANGQVIQDDGYRYLSRDEKADFLIYNLEYTISRKVYCNSPSEEGFQLVKTSTIDGVKCEHYEKDDLKVRTFIKDNGDFITTYEDSYGFDRIPESDIDTWIWCRSCDYPTRFYFPSRITTQSGIVCTREKVEGSNEFKFRNSFPVGNYIESTNTISSYPKTWQNFKSGDVTITYYSGDSLHIEKLNKNYPIVDLRRDVDLEYVGIMVNDRFCTLFPDGSISKSFLQKFDEHYYFANTTDTIVDVIDGKDNKTKTLKYANGDEVVIYYDKDVKNTEQFKKHAIKSSSIHRNGGILTFNVLRLPDGRVYQGSFMDRDGRAGVRSWSIYDDDRSLPNASILSFDTLTYYSGNLMLPPDGRIVEYSHGQSEEEIKREAQKSRQQKEAEEKAAYNKLCTKFGKKYVDAALAGKPIVGMPEPLFVVTFKPELSQEYANSKCYHVRGWGLRNGRSSMTLTNKALKYSVWVTNGKISSISTW